MTRRRPAARRIRTTPCDASSRWARRSLPAVLQTSRRSRPLRSSIRSSHRLPAGRSAPWDRRSARRALALGPRRAQVHAHRRAHRGAGRVPHRRHRPRRHRRPVGRDELRRAHADPDGQAPPRPAAPPRPPRSTWSRAATRSRASPSGSTPRPASSRRSTPTWATRSSSGPGSSSPTSSLRAPASARRPAPPLTPLAPRPHRCRVALAHGSSPSRYLAPASASRAPRPHRAAVFARPDGCPTTPVGVVPHEVGKKGTESIA